MVALGRALAGRLGGDRIATAGLTAGVLLGAISWLSLSLGTDPAEVALIASLQSAAIFLWLVRYAVSLRRAGTPGRTA